MDSIYLLGYIIFATIITLNLPIIIVGIFYFLTGKLTEEKLNNVRKNFDYNDDNVIIQPTMILFEAFAYFLKHNLTLKLVLFGGISVLSALLLAFELIGLSGNVKWNLSFNVENILGWVNFALFWIIGIFFALIQFAILIFSLSETMDKPTEEEQKKDIDGLFK